MDHLIAMVKGKRCSEYQSILSDQKVYELPADLDCVREYDNSYKLEEDEWFILQSFSKIKYCPELLKKPFSSTDYSIMNKTDSGKIEYICSYQNKDEYYFQRIFKYLILTKKLISLGDEIKLKEATRSIVVNDAPDALYIKSKDILYFKKLETIAPIFKGIDELYREATKKETEEFLNSSFVETVQDYEAENVGKANRRRIAMAMDTLNGLDEKEKKKVLDYTHKYYPNLKYKKGKFSVASNDDLKYLLWGIEERYYTTPVKKERRVANSIIRLESV